MSERGFVDAAAVQVASGIAATCPNGDADWIATRSYEIAEALLAQHKTRTWHERTARPLKVEDGVEIRRERDFGIGEVVEVESIPGFWAKGRVVKVGPGVVSIEFKNGDKTVTRDYPKARVFAIGERAA